jgi:hypothetical protein
LWASASWGCSAITCSSTYLGIGLGSLRPGAGALIQTGKVVNGDGGLVKLQNNVESTLLML